MFDKSASKVEGVSKKLKWREILIGKLLNLNYMMMVETLMEVNFFAQVSILSKWLLMFKLSAYRTLS